VKGLSLRTQPLESSPNFLLGGGMRKAGRVNKDTQGRSGDSGFTICTCGLKSHGQCTSETANYARFSKERCEGCVCGGFNFLLVSHSHVSHDGCWHHFDLYKTSSDELQFPGISHRFDPSESWISRSQLVITVMYIDWQHYDTKPSLKQTFSE